uniref:Uncharacterized protein n=1 Tax=Anopheles minimus TaxID=112268 RepID=A0A182WQE9_9DIPT
MRQNTLERNAGGRSATRKKEINYNV